MNPAVIAEVNRVIGAAKSPEPGAPSSPGVPLDPYAPGGTSWQGPMTPQQLANVDRALTPAEQKVVDAWLTQQANALAAKEEAKVYVDPKTGERRYSKVDFVPGDSPWSFDWKRLIAPIGAAVLGSASGALIWRRHRVIGGALGFLVGAGAGIGAETIRAGRPPWRR